MKPKNLNSIRLAYGTLVALYLGFIFSASFYLTGHIPNTEDALQSLLSKGSAFTFSFHNLRDVATNVLLYIPLGFVFVFYRASHTSIKILSPYLLFGFVVSLFVEVLQSFVGRFSDISDILSNATGYFLGYVTAYAAIRIYHLDPGLLIGIPKESTSTPQKTVSGLRFVYITISYITCLLPLNITVSLSEIHQKLIPLDGEAPRIILDPLYHLNSSGLELQHLVLNTLLYLPLAFLSSHLLVKQKHGNILTPAFHCLLFGFAIELSNIFIISGRSDIILPFLGFSIGATVSLTITKLYHVTRESNTRKADQAYLLLFTSLLYALFLLSLALTPFDFELTINSIKAKALHQSNFVPFKYHFSARSISSAIDIVKEVIQFMPFGALLTMLQLRLRGKSSIMLSAAIGFCLALFIEALQLMVIGRYVDLTDSFLGAIGCIAGSLLLPAFKLKSTEG